MKIVKPEFVGANKGSGESKMSWRARGCLFVLVLLVVVAGVLYFTFLEYVHPNEYGIKEVQIGFPTGIQEKVYEPGLAFVIPRWQKIHRLPRNVQVLELTGIEGSGTTAVSRRSPSVHHFKPANIQTSDGFFVAVDVTILYRIVDPYKVVTQLGPHDQYLHEGILPKAEPILKQTLGQLTTEDFYNSPARVEKAQLARELLDAEMREKGIEVQHVLVRYFKYSPAIQTNIEAKKLQDQLVFTNQAKRKAATAEQGLNRVTKEGEMSERIALEEGQAYRIKKDADRELYVRTKEAEADLLIQLAEAERTELRNEAMQVLGADRMVAMQMAEVLQGLEVILVPSGGPQSLNPFDLDSLLGTFGVTSYGDSGGPPPTLPPPARVLPNAAAVGQSVGEGAAAGVTAEVATEEEIVQ